MIIRKCNMCGKEFDERDTDSKYSFYRQIGYGSKYDGGKISLDLCCKCFDQILDAIIPLCKISPIEKNPEDEETSSDIDAKLDAFFLAISKGEF